MAGSLGGSNILGTEQISADHLPRIPAPARTTPPSSRSHARDDFDEKGNLLHRNDTTLDHRSPNSPVRSTRTADSVDLEKQALQRARDDRGERRSSHRSSPRRSGDRHTGLAASHIYMVGSVAGSSPHHQTIRQLSEGEDEVLDRPTLAAKAVRILVCHITPHDKRDIWTNVVSSSSSLSCSHSSPSHCQYGVSFWLSYSPSFTLYDSSSLANDRTQTSSWISSLQP